MTGIVARAAATSVPLTGGVRLGDLATELVDRLERDRVRTFAGNLAYRGLFAVFAILVLAFSFLGVFGSRHLIQEMIAETSPILPDAVRSAIEEQILGPARASASALTLRTAIAVLGALYGLSALARGVIDAMNAMYRVNERRPFWKRQAASVSMALVVLAMLLSALVLVAVGPQVTPLLRWIRWPMLLALVFLAFTLVYAFAPSVKEKVSRVALGAALMLPAWIAFTLIFSLFVDRYGRFSESYGSLAGIVVLLLYMFASAFIVLIGAEVNHVVATHRRRVRPEPSG